MHTKLQRCVDLSKKLENVLLNSDSFKKKFIKLLLRTRLVWVIQIYYRRALPDKHPRHMECRPSSILSDTQPVSMQPQYTLLIYKLWSCRWCVPVCMQLGIMWLQSACCTMDVFLWPWSPSSEISNCLHRKITLPEAWVCMIGLLCPWFAGGSKCRRDWCRFG